MKLYKCHICFYRVQNYIRNITAFLNTYYNYVTKQPDACHWPRSAVCHIINGMYVLNRCCIFFKVCVSFSDNYY